MGKIVINQDKCKGCGYCVLFCPKKMIVITDRLNKKGAHPAEFIAKTDNDCTGCAQCGQMCPDSAIEVFR